MLRDLERNVRTRIVELVLLALGPLIQATDVNDDLTFRVELYVGAVHRARRRAFKVHAFTVITTAVARALEFILACFPIGRTTEVSTTRVNDKHSI